MPYIADIDSAVVALLRSDVQLMTLCPDGVHWAIAPPIVPPAVPRGWVIVSHQDHDDTGGLNDTDLWETITYLVKAVVPGTNVSTAEAAARRIHALLHRAPTLTLTAAGYTLMRAARVETVRYPEIDPVEKSSRWQHYGGQYEIQASPDTPS